MIWTIDRQYDGSAKQFSSVHRPGSLGEPNTLGMKWSVGRRCLPIQPHRHRLLRIGLFPQSDETDALITEDLLAKLVRWQGEFDENVPLERVDNHQRPETLGCGSRAGSSFVAVALKWTSRNTPGLSLCCIRGTANLVS